MQTWVQHELPHGAPPGVHQHLLAGPPVLHLQQLRSARPRLRLLPVLLLRQLVPWQRRRRRLQPDVRRRLERRHERAPRRRRRRGLLPSGGWRRRSGGRAGILPGRSGWRTSVSRVLKSEENISTFCRNYPFTGTTPEQEARALTSRLG